MSNQPLSEQYRIIAKQWVDAEAAASLLEETKSARLSQMICELPGLPVTRAEAQVKATPEWTALVSSIVEARKKANLLKVQMAYIRMKSGEWQSEEASRRAEMRL